MCLAPEVPAAHAPCQKGRSQQHQRRCTQPQLHSSSAGVGVVFLAPLRGGIASVARTRNDPTGWLAPTFGAFSLVPPGHRIAREEEETLIGKSRRKKCAVASATGQPRADKQPHLLALEDALGVEEAVLPAEEGGEAPGRPHSSQELDVPPAAARRPAPGWCAMGGERRNVRYECECERV